MGKGRRKDLEAKSDFSTTAKTRKGRREKPSVSEGGHKQQTKT